jgi:hypothetical protein
MLESVAPVILIIMRGRSLHIAKLRVCESVPGFLVTRSCDDVRLEPLLPLKSSPTLSRSVAYAWASEGQSTVGDV